MKTHTRFVTIAAALGLGASVLIAAGPSQAAQTAPAESARAAATRPACETFVEGVLRSGQLVERDVKNTRIVSEQRTAAALPYRVDRLTYGGEPTGTSPNIVWHQLAFTLGQRVRSLAVSSTTGSPLLTVKTTSALTGLPGRLVTGSTGYYRYAVDGRGNLSRWTYFGDSQGNTWFGAKKVIAPNQGALKTLAWNWWVKRNGVYYDVLTGTTSGGALVQFQIPITKGGHLLMTTIARTGFAAYDEVSIADCNATISYASFVFIDRHDNRAQLYTLSHQFSPNGADLVKRGVVAPGANWHLHAVM